MGAIKFGIRILLEGSKIIISVSIEIRMGVRTISYAASCGDVEEISSHYEKQFFEIIRNLDKVGVREESLNRYLTDKKVNSSCNIDPTFLLSKEQYINDFLLSLSDKKYILVYVLQKNNILKVIAEKISEKLKLPVIYVCGYMAKGRHDKMNYSMLLL